MENKIYYIKLKDDLVEVSRPVWEVYYRGRAKIRYMAKVAKERNVSIDGPNGQDSVLVHARIKEDSLENQILNKETFQELHLAISTLSDSERLIIHNYYFLEQTETTIADKLGISQQGVNWKRKKALAKLKEILTD